LCLTWLNCSVFYITICVFYKSPFMLASVQLSYFRSRYLGLLHALYEFRFLEIEPNLRIVLNVLSVRPSLTVVLFAVNDVISVTSPACRGHLSVNF